MSCLQSLIQSKLWVKIIEGVLLGITFSIVATYIATPAITGVGVIILGSVLTGVGVPTEGILLVISIDRILGMFRTAINVTGDLTKCLVFNKRI
ncbi:dicarboxylate/amino acid:cation symporter [Flavobacteriales bacterium]|nr:dicarboxylate/amino acid:cation symporter [Flavobacteriales bacterium]